MKTLIFAALIFLLPSDQFSIYGTWKGHDTHHIDVELNLNPDGRAYIYYPENPEKKQRFQDIKFTYIKSTNDSVYFLDFHQTNTTEKGTIKDTTYCTFKFITNNKILYTEHPNLSHRQSGLGTKFYMER